MDVQKIKPNLLYFRLSKNTNKHVDMFVMNRAYFQNLEFRQISCFW
jgi:hypothetical protein